MKLLTPHFETYLGQKEEHALLSSVLAGEGIEYISWDATEGNLPEADAVFWQGVSSYHKRVDRFDALLKETEKRNIASFNTPSLLRWNAQKTYLQELEQKGILTIKTLWLENFDSEIISDWGVNNGFKELVIKPVISAGAHLTYRVPVEDLTEAISAYRDHPDRPIMIQPFLPEIMQEGEWSFLYFGGELSHVVRKTPKAGDYRIQHVHGGTYQREEPSAELSAAAQKVMQALPEQPLYARVDGIVKDGQFLLMEVELIEPYFYLDAAPEQGKLFAQKIAGAMRHQQKAA